MKTFAVVTVTVGLLTQTAVADDLAAGAAPPVEAVVEVVEVSAESVELTVTELSVEETAAGELAVEEVGHLEDVELQIVNDGAELSLQVEAVELLGLPEGAPAGTGEAAEEVSGVAESTIVDDPLECVEPAVCGLAEGELKGYGPPELWASPLGADVCHDPSHEGHVGPCAPNVTDDVPVVEFGFPAPNVRTLEATPEADLTAGPTAENLMFMSLSSSNSNENHAQTAAAADNTSTWSQGINRVSDELRSPLSSPAERVEPVAERKGLRRLWGRSTDDAIQPVSGTVVSTADRQLAERLAEIDRLRDAALQRGDAELLKKADALEAQVRQPRRWTSLLSFGRKQ
jgi:hypothetical protein